jgi:hypothetical protein
MPLANYAEYKQKVQAAQWRFLWEKGARTVAVGNPESLWLIGSPFAGSAPSTAAVCDRSTAGALLRNPDLVSITNPLFIAELEVKQALSGTRVAIMLMDRLSHQGGLSGTTTGEQTTNLPTAALTRYTDGVGVIAALQWYSATGSTGVTVTARYTNEGGTGSRTTLAASLAATRPIDTVVFLSTQDGDRGVRSVEGVTLSASTGTAGNFGVTLYKPLAVFQSVPAAMHGYRNVLNFLPAMHSNACIDLVVIASGTSTGAIVGSVNVIEVA